MHKKTYEDRGALVKFAFLEHTDSLFTNKNKDKSGIKSMKHFANTVMTQVKVMSNNFFIVKM